MKKGFTLIEIMIVLVIVGVMAGLAIPRFLKTFELQKVEVVKPQMKQIRTAIDVVSVNNKSYTFCTAMTDCDTTDEVNAALELDIHNSDFNFVVVSSGFSLWTIYAIRQAGPKNYVLAYFPAGSMRCYDVDSGACEWIKMTPEMLPPPI